MFHVLPTRKAISVSLLVMSLMITLQLMFNYSTLTYSINLKLRNNKLNEKKISFIIKVSEDILSKLEIETNASNASTKVILTQGKRFFLERFKMSPLHTTKHEWYEKKKMSVFLVTAGRSGSTFVADILKKHESLLYHFEPLRVVNNIHMDNNEELDDTVRLNEAVQYFNRLFACNVSQNYTEILGEEPRSKYTFEQETPIPPLLSLSTKNTHPAKRYNKVCKHEASHILIKELLERFPHTVNHVVSKLNTKTIQVLFLVRDPRATIYSMINAGMFKLDATGAVNVPKTIRKICGDIEKHFVSVTQSMMDFKIIRYEDFCSHFERELKDILTFLNLPFDANRLLDQYKINISKTQPSGINKITGLKDTRFTTNKDTKETFQKWRTAIPLGFAIGVEEHCKNLMNIFGYIPAGRDEALLRNKAHFLH